LTTITIADEIIPIDADHTEELQAAIERIIEDKKALDTKVNKLQKNVDEIVKEETKGLRTEKSALIKEVERLKVFDPGELDNERFEAQFQGIRTSLTETAVLISKLIFVDGLYENPELAARIEGAVAETEAQAALLRRQWTEKFQIY